VKVRYSESVSPGMGRIVWTAAWGGRGVGEEIPADLALKAGAAWSTEQHVPVTVFLGKEPDATEKCA